MSLSRATRTFATAYVLFLASKLVCIDCSLSFAASNQSVISGELKKWHNVTITFEGPYSSETATPNPFRDYRLNVTFTHLATGKAYLVPGHYAADGDAANTGATSGNKWRVHFAPAEEGEWNYVASFRRGTDIAVSSDLTGGISASFDGESGSLQIASTDKTGRDHRGKGLLRYVGEHYMRFAETGEYFIKGGPDDPENFLSYTDFDQTPAMHSYDAHVNDWNPEDPFWGANKGKGIIGALNYISGKGMNTVYFLTLNIGGDLDDVWPYIDRDERYRFDSSKLDQWEIVFSHMDKMGILLHVVHQEEEMDQLLDGGSLGIQRKLYYRELIARFAHHLAITWNLGEENTNSAAEVKEFSQFIKTWDPYEHPIVMHTFPTQKDRYNSLLGFPFFDGASLQHANSGDAQPTVKKWIDNSAAAGHKWLVTNDEQGQKPFLNYQGESPDSIDFWHDRARKVEFWAVLMAGGAGTEWYLGHGPYPVTDWRDWDRLWDQTSYGLEFFQRYLPFVEMKHNDALVANDDGQIFAKEGQIYAIYLPNGGTTDLDLGTVNRRFEVRWYDPRTGGALQEGTVNSIVGPGSVSIGFPPTDGSADWVALVRSDGPLADAGPDQFVLVGEELTLDGSGSLNPDGNPLTHSWNLGDGAAGVNGAIIEHTFNTPGTYQVALTVSDGVQTASDTAIVTVTSSETLLSDDFSDGSLDGWTIIDDGRASRPSSWSIDGEALRQRNNIYGGSTSGSALPKPGTYALAGDSGWSDYFISVRLRSTDNDAIGVMFRYQDNDNYYRFSMDRQRNYRRLIKKENGVFTLLAEQASGYVTNQWYTLDVEVNGELLRVWLDGELLFEAANSGLPLGRIALYSWGNAGSHFDDLSVSLLSSPSPNASLAPEGGLD